MKKKVLLALFVVLTALGSWAADGFHTSGTKLLDAKNNEFVMRGVNYAWVWQQGNESTVIPAAKRIGCNTIRLAVRYNDGRQASSSQLSNLIKLCRDNKLAVVVEDHSATGNNNTSALNSCVDYWKSVKDVLNANLDICIVNIANEWQQDHNATNWAAGYKTAIKNMRAAGIKNTLMVDADGYGQGSAIASKGAEVAAADELKNIMFSGHMYQFAGKDANTAKNYMNGYLKAGVPAVVGEFAYKHQGQSVAYQTIMDYCKEKNMGYLVWSWTGNSSDVAECDMFAGYDDSNYKENGRLTVNGTNGIKATSKELSVFNDSAQGGEDNPGGNEGTDETVGSWEPATPKAYGSKWGVEVDVPASAFVNAQEGDMIRMTFSDCGENPQVQLAMKDAAWTWTTVVEYADIVGGVYEFKYEDIAADFMANVKARGIYTKGQQATLVKVEVIHKGNGGGNDPDNPDNPDNPSGDLVVIGSQEFDPALDSGNWGKEVNVPKEFFVKNKVQAKDVLRMHFNPYAGGQIQMAVKLMPGYKWTQLNDYDDLTGPTFDLVIDNREDVQGNAVSVEDFIKGLKEGEGFFLKGQKFALAKVELLRDKALVEDQPKFDEEVIDQPATPAAINWSKEVKIPGSAFADVTPGSIVRIYTENETGAQLQIAYKAGSEFTWTEFQFDGNGYVDLVEDYIELYFTKEGGAVVAKAAGELKPIAEVVVNVSPAQLADIQKDNLYLKGQKTKYVKATLLKAVADGVEGVADDVIDFNAPVEIYTIQGVRVSEMNKGLYIIRQGNKVMKVMK